MLKVIRINKQDLVTQPVLEMMPNPGMMCLATC
jgi:hypothetical protein